MTTIEFIEIRKRRTLLNINVIAQVFRIVMPTILIVISDLALALEIYHSTFMIDSFRT